MRVLIYHCPDAPPAMAYMATWVDDGRGPALAFFRPMEIDARAAAQADYDTLTGVGRQRGAEKSAQTKALKKTAAAAPPAPAAAPLADYDDGEAI